MRVPPSSVTVGMLVGAAIALAPNSLPRDQSVQMVLLGVSVVIGAATGALVGRVRGAARGRRPRVDGLVASVGLVVFCLLVAANTAWQIALRTAMPDATPIGPGWALWSFTPAAVVVAWSVTPLRTPASPARVAAVAVVAAMLAGMGTGAASSAGVGTAVIATPAREPRMITGSVDARRDGPTAIRRAAQDVVDRWRANGGARRGAVVVAVPTGSGWVDPDAVAGFGQRFVGDVSVVSLAYDRRPSWRAYVGGTGPATDSAIALTSAVTDAVAAMPHGSRPSLYLYGQSLGAIGADAARRWASAQGAGVCATVVVGAPAGTIARDADRRVVIVNGSDPVARWSPSLLWSPPSAVRAQDLPRPPWFPLASFVQTSADLLGALSFPAGHGHQYGTEQGTRAPLCGRSAQIAPRAAS